jgi:glutamyl-tRNA synthetase
MTALNEATPVGRLAPSPTGFLHLGHARSFLLAWWDMRARGGRIVLRIEDLDRERVKPGMVDQVLRDLEWLGVDWDGPVWIQSANTGAFDDAIAHLAARGIAYPCVCTRKEIEAAQTAPHGSDPSARYPGTCRGRFASLDEAERISGRPAAMRLVVEPGAVELDDAFVGRFRCDVQHDAGDFPVSRRAGEPAYQLAVVVDDARAGVTDVVRGDDLLPSAARQLLVQRALGLASPTWRHVPLVVDEHGRRFAKRSDDLSLARLAAFGVDPRSIVRWVAERSGFEVRERCSPGDLVRSFDWTRVPRATVVCGAAELRGLTGSG